MGWTKVNKLDINPDKAEVLWVSRKENHGLKFSLDLGRVILSLKKQLHS